MNRLKLKSIINSWTFAFVVFFVFLFYIAFYSITDIDFLNKAFKIDSSITILSDFVLLSFLILLLSYLNRKKKVRKLFAIVCILTVFYAFLQIREYYYKYIILEPEPLFDKLDFNGASISKIRTYASENFLYKSLFLVDTIIGIVLMSYIMIVLNKRNLSKLIKWNSSVFGSFLAYLKKIKNEIKLRIASLIKRVKSIFFILFSKTNFVYIIKYTKLLKCTLKQDREHHILNQYFL